VWALLFFLRFVGYGFLTAAYLRQVEIEHFFVYNLILLALKEFDFGESTM
jgi:hypothetical protein